MDHKLLHIGCGGFRPEGFINSDIEDMDIAKPWPYKDGEADGIVSMHVLECLAWRDLIPALMEAYRVLKTGGVFRAGVPLIESKRPLSWLLGWSNINLFSFDLMKRVLMEIGFKKVTDCAFKKTYSDIPMIAELDNRPEETFYIEAIK